MSGYATVRWLLWGGLRTLKTGYLVVAGWQRSANKSHQKKSKEVVMQFMLNRSLEALNIRRPNIE